MLPLPLPTPPGPVSRRAVIAGAVGGCAVLCLSGCARYGDEDSGPVSPQPSAPAAAPSASVGTTASGGAPATPGLVAAAEVPVGGGVILADQSLVVTQPVAGTFAAFDTTCPHAGCSVSAVDGGAISCPCHGSRFRVTDGSVLRGPAKKGLTPRTVAAVDGQVRPA